MFHSLESKDKSFKRKYEFIHVNFDFMTETASLILEGSPNHH